MTKFIQFNNDEGRSLDAICEAFPTLAQTERHNSRSDQYRVLTTRDVLANLMDQGFTLSSLQVQKSRTLEKRAFAKHLIRMRAPDVRKINGTVPELIAMNASDGSTAWRVMGGFFRFVCANGMICGDTFAEYRIRHSGPEFMTRVLASVDATLNALDTRCDALEKYSATPIDKETAFKLVSRALDARYGDERATLHLPHVSQFLAPKREADRSRDLWTVFNVVQERVTAGGYTVGKKDERGVYNYRKAMPVRAINTNTNLQRKLWNTLELTAKEIAA